MNTKLPRIGEKLHGFTVQSTRPLDEYRGTGIRLRHEATGLDAYHLANDDEENLFAFAFKTPPADNTGAAHIIEHIVLSGSKRYPIKDPFLSLMKGSVNTFLNAMTYPDKTVYPAASILEKDYFNLMSVYGDAVFFPLLKRELFLQEGYRLVPNESGGWSVDGVVFNEMKGNYSSFESIVGEWSYRSVFSDSVYRFDSGGEPQEIPRLSYEDFTAFHRRYYHPSNCRLFLYGNIPTERQLEFIEEHFLKEFGSGEAIEDIERQRRWDGPRVFTVDAPAGEDGGKSTIIINWLTEQAADPLSLLTVQVLSDILIGHPGTPMYKTVVDSGLGEDVSPSSGLESDIAEPVFSIGVRGTLPEKREEFEKLVMEKLRSLVELGIPDQLARGALNRVEFRNREIKGGAPFGLRLMSKALRGWLHGRDPEETLEFTRHMEELKRRYDEVPGYFEDYLKRLLLNNPHRSTVTIVPKRDSLDKLQEAIAQAVTEHPDLQDETGEMRIREYFKAFQQFQETPDRREDLERIPRLSRSDLPKDISTIETGSEDSGGIPLCSHRLYTNGIAYVDMAFNLHGLSDDQLLLVPLLGRMISSSGLPGLPYDEVARRLAVSTGGLYHSLEVSSVVGRPDEMSALLLFRLKSLSEHIEEAFDLSSSILREAHVDDAGRIREVLSEFRNDMKASIIPAGHSYAALRAGSLLNPVVGVEDRWRGLAQLDFLMSIGEEGQRSVEELAESLRGLRDRIICRKRLLLNITAEEEAFEEVRRAALDRFAGPEVCKVGESEAKGDESPFAESLATATTPLSSKAAPLWESVIVPAAVGYAATVIPAAIYGEAAHPLQLLLAHLMKTDYLWEKVRMQGGAYGAFASNHGLEGFFSLLSYRDPDVGRSLEVFEKAFEDFAHTPPEPAELEKAVIALIGKDARPKSPGEKSIVGLRRLLYGISDESRREKRRRMLDARPADIAAQAAALKPEFSRAVRVIVAGEDMAAQAEARYPDGEKLRTRLRL